MHSPQTVLVAAAAAPQRGALVVVVAVVVVVQHASSLWPRPPRCRRLSRRRLHQQGLQTCSLVMCPPLLLLLLPWQPTDARGGCWSRRLPRYPLPRLPPMMIVVVSEQR